jgi:hypothetical protein
LQWPAKPEGSLFGTARLSLLLTPKSLLAGP